MLAEDGAFALIADKFGGLRKEPAMVRETGLEPVRDYHTPLKRARLPIPPLSLGTLTIITNAPIYVKTFFQSFSLFLTRSHTKARPALLHPLCF